MTYTDFCIAKILRAVCSPQPERLRMSINGVAEISLQAKISAPGRIDAIDGVAENPLRVKISAPGEIDAMDGVTEIPLRERILFL